MDLAEILLNPYLVLYILIVLGIQGAIAGIFVMRRNAQQRRRAAQGLTTASLGDQDKRLRTARREALWSAVALLVTVFGVPFLLKAIPGMTWEEQQGLAVGFGVLLAWVVISGTDVARALLGGLAFRTAAALHRPFQEGDRVLLRGVSGRVEDLGYLFTTLRTPDDNMVSIPTGSLWSEVLSSSNANEMGSLAIITVYLSTRSTREQRAAAEAALRGAVHASPYLDLHKPVQLVWRQEPAALHLAARAYVASTYNEPLFVSDVTRTFLDLADEQSLPLATPPLLSADAVV